MYVTIHQSTPTLLDHAWSVFIVFGIQRIHRPHPMTTNAPSSLTWQAGKSTMNFQMNCLLKHRGFSSNRHVSELRGVIVWKQLQPLTLGVFHWDETDLCVCPSVLGTVDDLVPLSNDDVKSTRISKTQRVSRCIKHLFRIWYPFQKTSIKWLPMDPSTS